MLLTRSLALDQLCPLPIKVVICIPVILKDFFISKGGGKVHQTQDILFSITFKITALFRQIAIFLIGVRPDFNHLRTLDTR